MDYFLTCIFAYQVLLLTGASHRAQAQPNQGVTTGVTTTSTLNVTYTGTPNVTNAAKATQKATARYTTAARFQNTNVLPANPYPQLEPGQRIFAYVRVNLKTLVGHVMVSWDIEDAHSDHNAVYTLISEYNGVGNCAPAANSEKQETPLSQRVRSYELENVKSWMTLLVTLKGEDVVENVVDYMSATTSTHEIPPRGTVSNIHTVSLQSDSAQIVWDPPLCLERGGILKNYAIEVVPTKDLSKKTPLTSTSQSLYIKNLQPFTEYQATITYINGQGQGPPSAPYTFQTSEGPSSAPFVYNFTFDDVTIGVIIVEPLQPNGLIEQYHLEITGGNTGLSNLYSPLNGTEYIIGKLQPNTTYSVRARARNLAGWGAWSPLIYVRTKAEVKPVPQALKQYLANSSCIGFSWHPPDDNLAAVSSYRITISSKDDVAHAFDSIVDKDKLSFVQCGLSPYRQYSISVSVMKDAGQFGQPMGAVMWTEGLVPPKPRQPDVTKTSSTTMTVNIYPVLFDGGPITSYEIRLLKLDHNHSSPISHDIDLQRDPALQRENNAPNSPNGGNSDEGPVLVPLSPQKKETIASNNPQQTGPEIHPVGKRSAIILTSDSTRSFHEIRPKNQVNKNQRLIAVVPDTLVRQENLSLWCQVWKQHWLNKETEKSKAEIITSRRIKIANSFTNEDDVFNKTGKASSYRNGSGLVYKIRNLSTVTGSRKSDQFQQNNKEQYLKVIKDKIKELRFKDNGTSHGYITSYFKKKRLKLSNNQHQTSTKKAAAYKYGNVHVARRRKRELGNPPGVLWLEIPASEVDQPSYIILGDDKLYYGKRNVPLEPATEYVVVYVVKSTIMDVTKHSYSFSKMAVFTEPAVPPEKTEDDKSNIWLIVLLVILILIFLILFILCGYFVLRHLARSKNMDKKGEKTNDDNYEESLSENEEESDLESNEEKYQDYEKPLRVGNTANYDSSKNTRDPEHFFNPIHTLGQPRYINSMRDNIMYNESSYPPDQTKNRAGNAINISLNNIRGSDGNNSATNITISTSSSRSSSGTSLVSDGSCDGMIHNISKSSISKKDATNNSCHNSYCDNDLSSSLSLYSNASSPIRDISNSVVLELNPEGMEEISKFTHFPRRNSHGSNMTEASTTDNFDEESLLGNSWLQFHSSCASQMTSLEAEIEAPVNATSSSMAEFRSYSKTSSKVPGEVISSSKDIQSSSSKMCQMTSSFAKSLPRAGFSCDDVDEYIDPKKALAVSGDFHNRNNSNACDEDAAANIPDTSGFTDSHKKSPSAETQSEFCMNNLTDMKLSSHMKDMQETAIMQLDAHTGLRRHDQSIFSGCRNIFSKSQDSRQCSTEDIASNIGTNQCFARERCALLNDKISKTQNTRVTRETCQNCLSSSAVLNVIKTPLSETTSRNRVRRINIGVYRASEGRPNKTPVNYCKRRESFTRIREPNCEENVASCSQKSFLQKSDGQHEPNCGEYETSLSHGPNCGEYETSLSHEGYLQMSGSRPEQNHKGNVVSTSEKSILKKSNNSDRGCHNFDSGCQSLTSSRGMVDGQGSVDGSECTKCHGDDSAKNKLQRILVSSIDSVHNMNNTVMNKNSCQDKNISTALLVADNASLEMVVYDSSNSSNVCFCNDTTAVSETKETNFRDYLPLGSNCFNNLTGKKHQREIDAVSPAVVSSNSFNDAEAADLPEKVCVGSYIEEVESIILDELPDKQLQCSCGELPFTSCSFAEKHQCFSGFACREYTSIQNPSGFTIPSGIQTPTTCTSVLKSTMRSLFKVADKSFPALTFIEKRTEPPDVAETADSLSEQQKTSLECASSIDYMMQENRPGIKQNCQEVLLEAGRYSEILEGNTRRFKDHLKFDLVEICDHQLDISLDTDGDTRKKEDLNDSWGFLNTKLRTSVTGLLLAENNDDLDRWGVMYRNINNSCNQNTGKYNNSYNTCNNSVDDDDVANVDEDDEVIEIEDDEEVECDDDDDDDEEEVEEDYEEEELDEDDYDAEKEEVKANYSFDDEKKGSIQSSSDGDNTKEHSNNENGNNNSPDPKRDKKDYPAKSRKSESSISMKKCEATPDKTCSLFKNQPNISHGDLDNSSKMSRSDHAGVFLTTSNGRNGSNQTRTQSRTGRGLSGTWRTKKSEQLRCPESQSSPFSVRHRSVSEASDGSCLNDPSAADFYRGSEQTGRKSVTFEKKVDTVWPVSRLESHSSSVVTQSAEGSSENKTVKSASQRKMEINTSSMEDGDIRSSKSSTKFVDKNEMSSEVEYLLRASSSSSIFSKNTDSAVDRTETGTEKTSLIRGGKAHSKKQWFHFFHLKKLQAKLEPRHGDKADKIKASKLKSVRSNADISTHENSKLMNINQHEEIHPWKANIRNENTSKAEVTSRSSRKKQGLFSLFLRESNKNENKPRDRQRKSLFQKDRSQVSSLGSTRNKNMSFKKEATGDKTRGRLSKSGQTVSFRDEFRALEKYKQQLIKTLVFDSSLRHPDRNRFSDILPPDHTRVDVEIASPGDSDYYNASYMDLDADIMYIAAQSPFSMVTVSDFWRLILQNKVETIVMMSKCVEGEEVKCVQYWADSGVFADGPVLVETVDQQRYADFTIRTLKVSASNYPEVMVTHFQFQTWPIYDVPDDPVPLLELRYRVRRSHGNRNTPIVVHCDTGVDQTAIFIAVDLLIEQYGLDGSVNVYGFVKNMRKSRPYMVRTLKQYRFIYECLFEEFQAGDTILRFDLDEKFKALCAKNPQTGFSYLMDEFRMLTEFTPNLHPSVCTAGLLPENAAKNVDQNIVPPDSYRPILNIQDNPFTHGYINAVFVDGLRRQREFLVTQTPLNNTVHVFWQMVCDYQVQTIVSLGASDRPNQAQYIPQTGARSFEKLLVEHINVSMQGSITIRNLKLCVDGAAGVEKRAIRHFQVGQWEDLDNIASRKMEFSADGHTDLLDLLEVVMDWQMVANKRTRPIVVCCTDGATSCGIFCSCAVLCERLQEDREVDLYHTVKHIKRRRPQFIADFDQYRFLHLVLWEYIQNHFCKEDTALDGGESTLSSESDTENCGQELGVQTEASLFHHKETSTRPQCSTLERQKHPEVNPGSQDYTCCKQMVLSLEGFQAPRTRRCSYADSRSFQKCCAACSGLYQQGSRPCTFGLAEDGADVTAGCSFCDRYVGTCEDNVGKRESCENICTCECSEQYSSADKRRVSHLRHRDMQESLRRQPRTPVCDTSQDSHPWRTRRQDRQFDRIDRRIENRQTSEDLVSKVTECSLSTPHKQTQVTEQKVRFLASGCQQVSSDSGQPYAESCRDTCHVSPNDAETCSPLEDVCSVHSSPTCTVNFLDESSSSEFDVSLNLI